MRSAVRPDQPVSAAIRARRSVRKFSDIPVDGATVEQLVALACTAPAPHHSRPWRFVSVHTPAARERLADAMTGAWRADLEREGRAVLEVDGLLRRSQTQLTDAPVLLIACLLRTDERHWPDDDRRRAERDMFVQSLGAALQNLLLAAGEAGLVGYLKGAPLFCAPVVRSTLDLPDDWEPTFLVLLGYPTKEAEPSPRDPIELEDFLIER
jgi:coenzyme F420-0:L-glutamate ligase / coenzyme F420-1:gamma-L-glutamate ligase